jgi:outer membrane lipopolysaccharide assembly protein LptE/RlpB
MKKLLALLFVTAVVSLLAACGSSRGHCEAYGSTNTVEQSDLASK